jgi:hypothetical protein
MTSANALPKASYNEGATIASTDEYASRDEILLFK